MSARIATPTGKDWSSRKYICERKLSELLDFNLNCEESSTSLLTTTSSLAVIKHTKLSQVLAKKSMTWAKDSLEKLPIRLTLENVGIFTVILSVIMPRAFTYILTYPIFRLVFGTLYPAYASYKAVRTKNVKEYVKWMMYWIVFALFTCAETFTDVFFSFWFPFYYEIKIILVLWLLSPATKGSSILYRRFVHPALCKREAEIDDALARATEQGYSAVLQLGTKGVNYATTVLMQTAIKGGGGLVQQLKKSYSLSDLTGEKEDENRNTEHVSDEVDLGEPRRRERSGRRGYSPRRTQSSSNHMEMYFSEVDVGVRKSRTREPVGSLTNIKSSDDISSGYSSGEALQSQRSSTNSENLVRTASVGSRNRSKPSRTTTKKTPEVGEDETEENIESIGKIATVANPLPILNTQQAFELLSFLSQNKNCIRMLQQQQNLSDSDDDSTLKAEPPNIKNEEVKPDDDEIKIDIHKINNDICSKKIDELKGLLQTANETISLATISSQENLSQSDNGISVIRNTNLLEIKTSPSRSRSNSDCSERAGKYNKKPAPRVPETSKDENENEDDEIDEEKPLKATLVLKTGTVKTLTNNEAVDAVIKRRKKTNAKTAARESFSKLLTLPKNIFHNAFHREKDEDSKSLNFETHDDIASDIINESKKSTEGSGTYISLKSDSIDADITDEKTTFKGETIV